ncbi:DUF6875 domain-containing protein [Longimicrobium sp.]|jgi:heptaprenyl diphosphate synthase|uniref:DUF6875 domain-containing protein n=1 Tax=Longimicrobium sp. TaxID=2029185 RepID=UPI002ED9805D
MPAALLNPEMIQVASTVIQWAREFLATENPQMKRPVGSKVVCPFVGPSLDNNSFYLSLHPEISGKDAGQIESLVLEYIRTFKKLGPFAPGDCTRKSLLLVFPSLPDNQGRVLDIVHESVKSVFVESGLMIGQFHKNCKEASVYNRGFLVSQSPVALIAIRHMAVHDILFVKNSREWFNAYNLHFGEKFNRPEKIEEYNRHLIDHYFEAKDRWQN